MPGRFDFGVARRDGTLDDVLRKIEAASQEMQRREDSRTAEEEACRVDLLLELRGEMEHLMTFLGR